MARRTYKTTSKPYRKPGKSGWFLKMPGMSPSGKIKQYEQGPFKTRKKAQGLRKFFD